MKAAEFREQIEAAIAAAAASEPTNKDARCRSFVACLTGRLQYDDYTLANKIWSLLGNGELEL